MTGKRDLQRNQKQSLPAQKGKIRNGPIRTIKPEVRLKDADSSLTIPDEVVRQSTVMTVVGRREITIDGHGGILDCESDCIRILTGKNELTVHGNHLMIDYYNNEELKIDGCIEQISWTTH